MRKYYFIIKTELQRQLTYRIEIYAYRMSNLLEVFALLLVWFLAYKNTDTISDYSQSEMITYVLVGWLFVYLSRSYGLYQRIEDDISEGKVSDFLVKPISYLKYMFALSLGRVSLSLFFSVLIQLVMILVFSKHVIFDPDPFRITIIFLMLVASYIIYTFMSFITGMIAFWTQRVVGIDHTINTLMKFLSGAYFPIILLPETFLKIDKLFPFIYTMYIPTQLYLGKISLKEGVMGLGMEMIWILLLYIIIKIMWKKGLKKFEGVGI